MNTTAGPIGGVAPPSNNRWWAIAAGIGLAAVLGYGAALISTDHLPGTSHTVAAPVAAVATPQVESIAGSDDLATRSATGSSGVVAQSALVPSVAGFEYGQEATAGHVASPGVTGQYFGNSGELYADATLVPSVGGFEYGQDATAGHVASPGVTGQYFGNSGELYPEAAAGSTLGIMAADFAGQGHSIDPIELYPAVVGASGVVAHSALDPFEERLGSPEARAATGTASASAEEFTRSPSDSAVGYFDGRWHGVGDPTESAEPLSQPSVAYFDGQWHIEEASNKYPTSEFR